MDNQSSGKWYQSTVGIIILLILFFPVGLYLMWKYAKWSSKAKWIITGVFILIVVIGFTTGNKHPKEAITSMPTDTPTPTKVQATPVPKGNITVDMLGPELLYFNPNPSTFKDGRYISYSKDGKNNLTLIGSENNITTIMLALNRIDNSMFTTDDMVRLISNIAHDAVPDWKDADTWINDTYKLFISSSDDTPTNKITVENKSITLSFDKATNNIGFTIVVNK